MMVMTVSVIIITCHCSVYKHMCSIWLELQQNVDTHYLSAASVIRGHCLYSQIYTPSPVGQESEKRIKLTYLPAVFKEEIVYLDSQAFPLSSFDHLQYAEAGRRPVTFYHTKDVNVHIGTLSFKTLIKAVIAHRKQLQGHKIKVAVLPSRSNLSNSCLLSNWMPVRSNM